MASLTDGPALARVPDVASLSLFVPSSVGVTAATLFLYTSAYGMSLAQNFLVIVVVSALAVGGLTFSYANSLYTTRINFHRADKSELSGLTKKSTTAAEDAARANTIKTTSSFYALTFVNGAFFVIFILLSLGTTSGLPVVYKYILTSLVPPAVLAFLTSPAQA